MVLGKEDPINVLRIQPVSSKPVMERRLGFLTRYGHSPIGEEDDVGCWRRPIRPRCVCWKPVEY